jgi:hypothetical protein
VNAATCRVLFIAGSCAAYDPFVGIAMAAASVDPFVGIAMAAASVLLVVFTLLLFAVVAYKRRSWQQADSIVTSIPRRPAVSWQVGRWDTDRRHVYVANFGDETAYQVSVMGCGRALGAAERVAPFHAGRLSSTADPRCYLNVCLDERFARQVSRGADGASRRAAESEVIDLDRGGMVVRVRWRSEQGEWFTQMVRPD